MVRFPQPLDYAVALRAFQVVGANGESLEGSAQLTEEERCWTFTPTTPWPAGQLKLVTASSLEDLAGNNIGKPFDVDLSTAAAASRISAASTDVPVEIR